MIRPLLSALLCLSMAACSTSVKNPAQAARVDKIRLGAVTAEAPDAKGIEKEFKRARLKRGMAESLLMVSGVAVAGAIGEQSVVNNHIIQSNWDRASAPPVPPGTGIDDLTAGEVALKNRILQLAATQQPVALGRALKDYAPTGKRVSGSGAYRLDCRITFAGHDRRKKSQYR